MQVRPLEQSDRPWVDRVISERWGADTVAAHGTLYHPAELLGLAAIEESEPVGLLTYHVHNHAYEIVTIDSFVEGRGAGTALVEAVADEARRAGCGRLWLITTNDNLPARRLYEKRGFSLAAAHRGAVAESRKLKPESRSSASAGSRSVTSSNSSSEPLVRCLAVPARNLTGTLETR